MATTKFFLGGGSDGKTFFRWFDTSSDILQDLFNVCHNDAVAYYSCLLIDVDLSLSEEKEKEEAREGLSFAFDEYCKKHTHDIEAFCNVVKGMLSIFSRSYIGRNSFARMSAEAVQVRHSNALIFLDEWRASKGGGKSFVSKKTTKQKKKTFRDFISKKNVSDPNELLKILHDLIDSRKGKDVGLVLLRAYAIDEYLTDKPTKEATLNEFTIVGSWSGVHHFMDKENNDYMKRAKKITIL